MRILVAEDEPGVSRFIQKGLSENGYATDVVEDGIEAIEHLEAYDYDIVILDIMMPRLDGIGVLRRMREVGNTSPVILLTARDGVDDRVGGLDAGADDYLVKPFAFPELLARIRALLRRPPIVHGGDLEVGPIKMDPAMHAVTVDQVPVQLSIREYALLELFLRYPGQVLTRTQIAQSVWRNNFDTGTNVVDVYVGYLRRKLDRGQNESCIETIRGVGYRLRYRP